MIETKFFAKESLKGDPATEKMRPRCSCAPPVSPSLSSTLALNSIVLALLFKGLFA